MRKAIYILGVTALFALLGLWFGRLNGSSILWTTALGAAIGFMLGTSFQRFVPSR